MNLNTVSKSRCSLKLCHWNIEGINSKYLGSKIEDPSVYKEIKNFDIIGLTETHALTPNSISLEGYTSFQSNRKKHPRAKKGCGGIAVLIKNEIRNGVKLISSKSTDIIWLKLLKSYSNLPKDLFIGVVYISPQRSTYSVRQETDPWEILESEVECHSTNGDIMIMGDLNTRTGILDDYIKHDDDEFTPVPNDYMVDNLDLYEERENQDKISGPKEYVEKLLNICSTYKIRILNGRSLGDLCGKFTCYQYNGQSVVDYMIVQECLLTNIKYFKVHDTLEAISDHCLISAELDLPRIWKGSTFINSNVEKVPPPIRIEWDDAARQIFCAELESTPLKNDIESCLYGNKQDGDLNVCVEGIQDILMRAVQKIRKVDRVGAHPKALHQKRNQTCKPCRRNQKKWFDSDCLSLKRSLVKMGKQLVQSPRNAALRVAFHVHKKLYKKTLKMKENAFRQSLVSKLNDLSENNPRAYWKVVEELRNSTSSKAQKSTSDVPLEEWQQHYENLLNQPPPSNPEFAAEIESLENEPFFSALDVRITVDEVLKAAKGLKSGKAVGFDNISNEMIKASMPIMGNVYAKVFNSILLTGFYPKIWSKGYIVNLFKSGSPLDPNNYRGITINSCLGKLFSCVLNNRLEQYIKDETLLHPSQIGFKKGARTSDHIMTVSTLVDKYVKKMKGPLYTCFIDFRKAYDSVIHEGLFLKLLRYNIRGNFYNVIKNMYLQSSSCIRADGYQSPFFACKNGVKQGETLSPLLFNLFLNDLPNEIQNGITDKASIPELNGRNILLLLYADDLILMSRTASGLQEELNALGKFCQKWHLNINVNKTKVMKFVGNGHICKDIFTINGQKLENCSSYKYLGTVLSASGSFKDARINAANKAKKALFSVRSCLRNAGTNPRAGLRLFDQVIAPILLYGSEIWATGTIKPNKFTQKWAFDNHFNETECEKVHISFCKFLLGVSRKTGNVPVMSELGRFPMSHKIVTQMIGYWDHLSKTDNPILKDTFLESQKLNREGHQSWVGFYKFMCLKLNIDVASTKKSCREGLRARFNDFWNETFIKKYEMEDKGKFNTYVSFKNVFGYEGYLDKICDFNLRRSLTKFRLSNHGLQIERGRYTRPLTPREMRLCEKCSVVDDEFHFIMKCSKFDNPRKVFLNTIKVEFPALQNLSDSDLFKYLMISEGQTCIRLAKFCKNFLP